MIVEYLRNFDDLTYTEESIRKYILGNPQEFSYLTIKELSKECNVGMASINRFCKKLGYDGFTSFKNEFLKGMKDVERIDNAKKLNPFDQTTTTKDIINDLPYIYQRSIGFTQACIDENVLHRVVGRIQNSTVLIYATGINVAGAKLFAYKLEELGIYTIICDSLHYQFIDSLQLRGSSVYAILLSHRGENEVVIKVAELLKRRGINSLLICGQISDSLRPYIDDVLYSIPTYSTKEFGNTQWVISQQYILDIIYSILFVKNLRLIDNYVYKDGYRKFIEEEKNE